MVINTKSTNWKGYSAYYDNEVILFLMRYPRLRKCVILWECNQSIEDILYKITQRVCWDESNEFVKY